MKNILLALLPFWTPLIPPMGIARIKSYLTNKGYKVKTIDATVDLTFKRVYSNYFNNLRIIIPVHNQANFLNVGHDVLQNHMMAHINKKSEFDYNKLVRLIIYNTYYYNLTDVQLQLINSIVEDFFNLLEKYVINLIEEVNPNVFGLTVYCHTLPASLFAFQLVKAKYPEIKNVMGGGIFTEHLAVGTDNYNRFLEQTPYIDKIIVGEGEELLYNYLEGKLEDSNKVSFFSDIEKNNTGNLFSSDIPDLNDFNLEYYPYLSASCSKGCPFQCSFCSQSIFYGKYRKKEIKQTVQEMITMRDLYKGQLFNMVDALLNPLIMELSKEFISKNESIYWEGYLRVGELVCKIENTMLWRRGGFYRAQMGLESGSQHVLDMMDKRITPELSRAAIASLACAGIKTTTYWVIGHPGETEEDFQATLDFVEEAKDDIYEAEFHPFQFVNLSGQVNSDKWSQNSRLLYPESAKDSLMIQTWIVDTEPTRMETYRRLSRFKEHINKLGIPNLYSIDEIYNADERWKKLHKNAVPSLFDFKQSSDYISECKHFKEKILTDKTLIEEGDFDF